MADTLISRVFLRPAIWDERLKVESLHKSGHCG